MIRTVEAVIDEQGNVRLLEPVKLGALGEDWDRPEEDAAWAHLQPPAC